MNDIKLIISDLDGTLLNEEKLVSDATKQAIEACKIRESTLASRLEDH